MSLAFTDSVQAQGWKINLVKSVGTEKPSEVERSYRELRAEFKLLVIRIWWQEKEVPLKEQKEKEMDSLLIYCFVIVS